MRKSFLAAFAGVLALIGYTLWRSGSLATYQTAGPQQVQRTSAKSNAVPALALQTRSQQPVPATGTNTPTIPVPQIMVGTNFGYSNGVYFQTVMTQVVLPQPPPDYEAWQRGLHEWKERNARLGIDEDIAKREAELKEKAKLLAVGMTPEQVIDVMGKPDLIKGFVVEGTNAAIKVIDLGDLAKYESKARWISFSYTPYEPADYVRFRRKAMRLKRYDNLAVSFDENAQLKWYDWGW